MHCVWRSRHARSAPRLTRDATRVSPSPCLRVRDQFPVRVGHGRTWLDRPAGGSSSSRAGRTGHARWRTAAAGVVRHRAASVDGEEPFGAAESSARRPADHRAMAPNILSAGRVVDLDTVSMSFAGARQQIERVADGAGAGQERALSEMAQNKESRTTANQPRRMRSRGEAVHGFRSIPETN